MNRSGPRTLTIFTRILLLFLVSIASAHPPTLHFDNFNLALDGTELPLVDNAGNRLIAGFVSLYQFGNPASAPSDFGALRSNGGDGLLNLVKIRASPIVQGELGPRDSSLGSQIELRNFGTCLLYLVLSLSGI